MDTHMHSKASDGIWTPREVVQNAKAKGLEIIALTDHDTTFGVAEAQDEAKKQGITLIPGIEIDAKYQTELGTVRNIELLGLNIDVGLLQPLVDRRNHDRLSLMEDYVRGFNDYISSETFTAENENKQFKLVSPRPISLAEIVDWYNQRNLDSKGVAYQNPNPFLSKMTLVQFIADKFLASGLREKILKAEREAGDTFKKEYKRVLSTNKESKPSFYEAIQAVKAARGKAVVAHPGLSKGYEDGMIKEWEMPEEQWFTSPGFTAYRFIEDLTNHGLDGIELYNYRGSDKEHSESHDLINKYFTKLANKLGLITTFGSDCHGPKGKGPLMGTFGSPTSYLNSLGREETLTKEDKRRLMIQHDLKRFAGLCDMAETKGVPREEVQRLRDRVSEL